MMPQFVQKLMIIIGGILTAAAGMSSAQQPPAGAKAPSKGRSLDQQLLDDLDRELLQGLPAAKRPPAAALPPGGNEKSPARSSPDANEAESTSIESQNPLAQVARRMRSVESRIARHNISSATQGEQAQIVSDLEALLDAAKKGRSGGKQGQQKKGAGAQPGIGAGNAAAGPPRDSTNRIEHGSKEQAQTADVKDVVRRFWGHLPQKYRDEMQASLSEQFLPKYERLIEEYYKRLAEEQPGGP
jgi:hypothetical protein